MKIVRLAITCLTVLLVVSCAPATAQPTARSTTPVPPTPASAAPTATPVPPTPTPVNLSGGTFVRAMTTEPASIDPQGAASSGLSLVLPYLFDTLVVYDTDFNLVPALAESWQVATDGKEITLKLKAGVTFHDGTPFNAQAVQFTFQRFKESGTRSPIYGGIQQISGLEVVDDLTIRFVFKEPTANFWSTLTMPFAGIISPASARKVAETGKGNLVGTGPFVLDKWQVGQSITLKRNPAYQWGPALVENRTAPYLDALVFKVIPDATTQLAALETGAVDAIFVNQPDHHAKLKANPKMQVHETVLNSLIYLGFNCKKPPFADPQVRRALSHAVNKDEILRVALGGIGVTAFAPLPSSLPGFDASLKAFELGYDPKQAQALLKEAGFVQGSGGTWEKQGQPLKGVLLTSNRAPNDTIAVLLQSQLKAIGVPIEIQTLDSRAVMDATTQGKFDLLVWRYDWNDPDALDIFLGTNRIGSTNRVAYSNPKVDALLAQGARELDAAKRKRIYVEAQKLILQDAPWQPLYVPLDVIATSKRVSGIKIGFMGRMLLNDTHLSER